MQPIHGLRFDNIRGDVYGGLTAAVVALPPALAVVLGLGGLARYIPHAVLAAILIKVGFEFSIGPT